MATTAEVGVYRDVISMMQFDYIDCIPVMPLRIVAEIVGIPEAELSADFLKTPGCGLFEELCGYKAMEYDELWDYLEPKYPEAFHAIFG